jgi:hypothetical protein
MLACIRNNGAEVIIATEGGPLALESSYQIAGALRIPAIACAGDVLLTCTGAGRRERR